MNIKFLLSILVAYVIFDILLSFSIFKNYPENWNILMDEIVKPTSIIYLIIAIVIGILVYYAV